MTDVNPFQSPDSAEPIQRPRLSHAQTRAVKSTQFALLGIQFTGLGALLLLVAIPVSFHTLWGLVGVGAGAGFAVAGLGLLWYKPWGWHCGAVLILPLLGLMAVLIVLQALNWGWIFGAVALILLLLYSYYALHALFSQAGSQRYSDTAQAKLALRQKKCEPRRAEPLDFF